MSRGSSTWHSGQFFLAFVVLKHGKIWENHEKSPVRWYSQRLQFIEDFHGFSIEDQNRFEDISQWIGSLTLSTNSVSASEFLSLDSREWMELIQKWNCEQEFPVFCFSTFLKNYLKVRKRWFIPYPDAAWTYHRAAWLAQTSLIISVNSDPGTLNYLI